MSTYKKYLYTRDDHYSYKKLEIGSDDFWSNVTNKAYTNARLIMSLNTDGVTMNDRYNETIVEKGKDARVDIFNPITLFAPYAMTYDPDILQTDPIGWPIRSKKIQDKGYKAVHNKQPSCITFFQNCFFRMSPYTSHCSAYVAWIAQQVFGINLAPTQIGDWCHAAAEQRDIMTVMTDYWERVDAIGAQYQANMGKLAIAVFKVDDMDGGYKNNGHIAIILPIGWRTAMRLQTKPNYPATPIIKDVDTFQEFIKRNGPEIAQSGGLNFSHTVAANGFANYYPEPSVTPIDNFLEFFVYRLYTQNAIKSYLP